MTGETVYVVTYPDGIPFAVMEDYDEATRAAEAISGDVFPFSVE